MRLDAHPVVVAVALGLLGPAALESDEDDVATAPAVAPAPVTPPAPCADCPADCATDDARS